MLILWSKHGSNSLLISQRHKKGKLEKLETKLKNVLDKYKHVEASEESAIDIYTELKNIYESGNEQ